MLKRFIAFMCGVAGVVLPLIHIYIQYFAGEAYRGTWQYVTPFFAGYILNSITLFLSGIFYRDKNTNWLFVSTLISTLIYIALSLAAVRNFYIIGVGIAYVASEIIRLIIILNKVKGMCKIRYPIRSFLINIGVMASSILLYYLVGNVYIHAALIIVYGLLFMVINREIVFYVLSKIRLLRSLSLIYKLSKK